jgi:cytochrome c
MRPLPFPLTFAILSMLAALPAAAQNAERGRQLFNQCSACHTVQAPSGADGPALAGVVGRASASLADFRYSRPMGRANLTWDEATLDRYLASPQEVVPGTRMAFAGLAQAADRADLIAYLKSLQ